MEPDCLPVFLLISAHQLTGDQDYNNWSPSSHQVYNHPLGELMKTHIPLSSSMGELCELHNLLGFSIFLDGSWCGFM